mgnify:FL=1
MMKNILRLIFLTIVIFPPSLLSADEVLPGTKLNIALIERLLERCLEIARSLPNDDEEYDSAINPFAQEIRSSRARIIEDVSVTQAIAGDIETALHTISTIDNPSWRNPGLFKIVQAQANTGDLVGAKDTAMSTITNISYLDMALMTIGQKYSTAGDIENASTVYPDYGFGKAKHFLNIAAAQATAGDAKGALKTYGEALKKAEQEGNAATFKNDTASHLIGFQMQAGDYIGALRTSEIIPGSKNLSYLEMLAEIHVRMGNQAAAREMTEKILANTNTIASQPDRNFSLAHVARAFAIIGDVERAIEVSASIKPLSQSWASLRDLAAIQARTGNVREALQIQSKITGKRERAFALQAIAKEQAQHGDIGQAIKTARSFKNQWTQLQTLGDISNASTTSPDMRQVLSYLPRIAHEGKLAWAAKSLAAAQARSGGADAAMKWASQQTPFVEAATLVGVTRGLLGKTAD